MKKLYYSIIGILVASSTYAQAPEKMSYQAVIRDASGTLVANQTVGMQISILQGSTSGTAVYVETQTPTSNTNGLVTTEIGTGTVVSGAFSNINWGNGSYFIKTESDPTGGTNYTIAGTSQLMSVPYAFHAAVADSVVGGNSSSTGTTDKFYLGQDTLGGIVFYLYKDSSGEQHGLIVNKGESMAVWDNIQIVAGADRTWDGSFNTNAMISSPAAAYVNGLTDGGFTDWYLPSMDEIFLLWSNRFTVNREMHNGGHTLLTNVTYWTSTEKDANKAYSINFKGGSPYDQAKSFSWNVRAIRAF